MCRTRFRIEDIEGAMDIMAQERNWLSEVEFNSNEFFILDSQCVTKLKQRAKENESGKFRTCIHFSDFDDVHEMLVAHTCFTYVRPHKHKIHGESLHVIEGEATVIVFDEDGGIIRAHRIGDVSSPFPFYYSIRNSAFHMLLIHSEYFIFKETTQGPFVRDHTIFPNWAPGHDDPIQISRYIASLESRLKVFQSLGDK